MSTFLIVMLIVFLLFTDFGNGLLGVAIYCAAIAAGLYALFWGGMVVIALMTGNL